MGDCWILPKNLLWVVRMGSKIASWLIVDAKHYLMNCSYEYFG